MVSEDPNVDAPLLDQQQQEAEAAVETTCFDDRCFLGCTGLTVLVSVLAMFGSLFYQDDDYGTCSSNFIGPRSTMMLYVPRFSKTEIIQNPAEKLDLLREVTGRLWPIDHYADTIAESPTELAKDAHFRPEWRSAHWIVNQDNAPGGLLLKDDFLERYALADMYFHYGGPRWRNSKNWLSPLHVCEWERVTCCTEADANLGSCRRDAVGKVLALDLSNNNLRGHQHTEAYVLLTELRSLDLSNNAISGQFWGFSAGQLPFLEHLALHNNKLTGSLPENLFQYEESRLSTFHGIAIWLVQVFVCFIYKYVRS